MSCSSAALPNSFDRFREIWHVDFEFRQDENHCPVPVSMFANEHRTGAEIAMRRGQLLTCTKAPFPIDADTLVIGYSVVAELTCFQVLHWPRPRHVLCTYFETSAQINGLEIAGLVKKRPSLLEACDLFDIPHMEKGHKDFVRDIILNNTDYTEEQWRLIEDYNRDDVLLDIPLFAALAPNIDVLRALFRGRYAVAVADMELRGIPVDTNYLHQLQTNWQALRLHYIRRADTFRLYDESGSFCEDRIEQLIKQRGWAWPRTVTGKPELKGITIGKQCKKYPELKPLQRLRDQIAELRLGAFVNTVGADGFSRCPIMPFWTRSGRNQPSGRDKVFLPSLPSWVHGLIKPPPGWGVAALDWSAQEIGIAARLSGDPALIADFQSGDPHMQFAIRAGLAPLWATQRSHGPLRDAIKPVSLGVGYGMSKYGAAAATGKSLLWASEILAAHRHAYPTFMQWQHDMVTQAMFDEHIVSPLGWPMAVHVGTRRRTLLNYPAQSGGGDCMRVAAIAAHEVGIQICCSVHDSFWITATLSELDDAIATMTRLMVKASNVVTGGLDIPVKKSADVRAPQRLGDTRAPDAKGQRMWVEVRDLVCNGGLGSGRSEYETQTETAFSGSGSR
jgi:DNA polymerase family A